MAFNHKFLDPALPPPADAERSGGLDAAVRPGEAAPLDLVPPPPPSDVWRPHRRRRRRTLDPAAAATVGRSTPAPLPPANAERTRRRRPTWGGRAARPQRPRRRLTPLLALRTEHRQAAADARSDSSQSRPALSRAANLPRPRSATFRRWTGSAAARSSWRIAQCPML